jgi:hypothetical protein
MNIAPFSVWSEAETSAALAAMQAHAARQQDNPFVDKDSAETLMGHIRTGVARAALMGGYLLVYDVSNTVFSDSLFLFEYLFLRIAPGASFGEAVEGMKHIARLNGCIGVITGNGVRRPGLRRLYERHGAVAHNEAYYIGV